MQQIYDIQSLKNVETVATLGFFDGVHKGHRFLIEQVKAEAKKSQLKSLIVTFDEHPRKVLNQNFKPKLLNTHQERIWLLQETNVDFCYVIPFTKEFSQLSSFDFLKTILHDQLHVKKLIIGHDHHFGHNRDEGFQQYKQYGRQIGIEITQSVPYIENDTTLSSSVIRRLLECGDIEKANHYLGYEYFLSGKVILGQQIGRKIHFPTANIQVDESKQLPMPGIYAVKVRVKGKNYNGMLNIGARPTIENSDGKTSVEVNIFDFNKDIYNEEITIFFVKRTRNEIKFPNIQQLIEQLKIDERIIREILQN